MSDEYVPEKQFKVRYACTYCQVKKIKCSGFPGPCKNCKKNELCCTFKPISKKRGPQSKTKEVIYSTKTRIDRMLQKCPNFPLLENKSDFSEDPDPILGSKLTLVKPSKEQTFKPQIVESWNFNSFSNISKLSQRYPNTVSQPTFPWIENWTLPVPRQTVGNQFTTLPNHPWLPSISHLISNLSRTNSNAFFESVKPNINAIKQNSSFLSQTLTGPDFPKPKNQSPEERQGQN
ncbi:hypothetical protein G9A89_023010 [Geosiphon pyriformis]|nr:hypothetical protein G9A89_023010 [Geosiphon pyriformis]